MSARKNLRKALADKTAKEYFLEQSAAYFDELVAAGQISDGKRTQRWSFFVRVSR